MQNALSSVARPGELSPLQKAFARCYVLNGGNAQKAALEAGYSPGGSEQIALRNVRHKLVIAEIKRLSVVEVGARLPEIIAKLWEMVEADSTPPDVKARILFQLMDRGGMPKAPSGPATQVNVQINAGGSSALIQEIWASRSARERALSVIDGSMPDKSDDDDETVDATPDDDRGQVELPPGDG